MGLDDIETTIITAELLYLGRLARYDDDRIGKLAPGRDVTNGSEARVRTIHSQKHMWWRVKEMMSKTEIPEEEWPQQWQNVASDRMLWKRLTRDVAQQYRERYERYTWESRHELDEVAKEVQEKAESSRTMDGKVNCPICAAKVRQLRSHLPVCGKEVSNEAKAAAAKNAVQCP